VKNGTAVDLPLHSNSGILYMRETTLIDAHKKVFGVNFF